MVFLGVVRANGAVWVPLAILFVAMFPVRLGFALSLRPILGADALWWSFPVGSVVTLAGAALYYVYGDWRRGGPMPVTPDDPHPAVEPAGGLTPVR